MGNKPAEIAYRRWKHKEAGYTVEVLGVYHYTGTHGHYSTVKVKGSLTSKTRLVTWSAKTFLEAFKPRGKKLVFKSKWDRLRIPLQVT